MLLAIGGIVSDDFNDTSSLEVLDPSMPTQSEWRVFSRIPTGRRTSYAVAVLDNKVYVCGGISTVDTSESCVSYDPYLFIWNTGVASMLERRVDFALASLGFDTLYAVGGLISDKSVECYNAKTNIWSKRRDLPGFSLIGHSMVSLNGYLYAAGGLSFSDKSLYKYNPISDTWTRLPDMPSPRKTLSLVAVPSLASTNVSHHQDSGYLYVIGGYDGHYELDTVIRFNFYANRWETDGFPGTRLTGGVYSPVAALLGSNIYAVGGLKLDAYTDRYISIDSMQSLFINHQEYALRLMPALRPYTGWLRMNHTLSKPRRDHILVKVKIIG